jgi:hypothetical protein
MAHYAVLDDNNMVTDVITGRDEDDLDALPDGFASWEEYYSNVLGARCLRTSYNTQMGQHLEGKEPFRLNYSSIGGYYDEELDGFIPAKPEGLDSWVLNPEEGQWYPPFPPPDDGLAYNWDEVLQHWERRPGSPDVPYPDDGKIYKWNKNIGKWVPDSQAN